MTLLPPRTLWFGLIRTTLLAWLVVRGVLAWAEAGDLPIVSSLAVVGLVAWLGTFDLRVAREQIFVDNLGVPRASLYSLTFMVGAALELLTAVVL